MSEFAALQLPRSAALGTFPWVPEKENPGIRATCPLGNV
jgi:hypothetical protein